MSAAEALSAFLAPLLPGWTVQFGAWEDEVGPKVSRFAVIKPAGGARAELLRRPQFTLFLIGKQGDPKTVPFEAADTVIEAMRATSGSLVFMQPGEPAYHPTTDRRPVAEMAVSTITT